MGFFGCSLLLYSQRARSLGFRYYFVTLNFKFAVKILRRPCCKPISAPRGGRRGCASDAPSGFPVRKAAISYFPCPPPFFNCGNLKWEVTPFGCCLVGQKTPLQAARGVFPRARGRTCPPPNFFACLPSSPRNQRWCVRLVP